MSKPQEVKMAVYGRKLELMAIALLLLAVVGGVAGCKESPGKDKETTKPTVTSLTHSWGTITDQQTSIKSRAKVKNPYPFAISLKTIEYQILLEDTTLVEGVITKNTELPVGSETEVTFEVVLDNARLSQWWVIHIKNKERTTFTYKGNIDFDLRAMEFKYPFKQSYEMKTNLLGPQS